MRRADLADLQIGAGGDVDSASAEALGNIGEALGLVRQHDAAGQAKPQHERVLARRDIK
jgi:hypothetical protein